MKVAVSGATGFIGGHVVRVLLQRGIEPTLWVRPGASRMDQWSGLPTCKVDFTEPPEDLYLRLDEPEVLIHLAWGGLPNYRSPHHLEVELPMQCRLLEALVRGGLPKLVVTGTCFEYGMQSGELREDTPPHPENPYGQAKDQLRQALETLQHAIGYELTWARLFYMFGEDQSPNSLYPLLRKAAMSGDDAFPMSGGEQVRDFLPVEAVAQYLVDLALLNRGVGIVNVCSGEPITVLDRVERWIADNGWSVKPKTGVFPYPDYEPMAFWGSAKKLHTCIKAGQHE